MFLELQQQSMLIGKQPSGFTEHYYTEWDDGLGKERISLFLVISIASSQVPGDELGKEAFQLLQDHFLDDLSGDPYDRFENALREVNLMINEKEEELGVKFIPNVHVVCGVIQKDMLFLSQRGEGQGYLVRKRHVSSITEGLSDVKNHEDLFQNIASGVLEVGDSVILVTGPLVQYVTPSDLSKIFSEQALGEATKELKELLHSDLDEQLALLSFEILEKGHKAPKAEGHDEEEPVFEAAADEGGRDDAVVTLGRWTKGLGILRGWVSENVRKMERPKLLKLIVAVAVVIVVGVLLLRLTTGQQKVQTNMQGKLELAEENITQAETRGAFDKSEADELLNGAEGLAVEVLNSGFFGGQASEVLDRIEEQRDFLDNVIRLDDEVTQLVDFSGILGSASIRGVLQVDEKHLVYTENEAYEVLIDEAQSPVTLDASEAVLDAAYFSDRNNVLMLTDGPNLIEYTEGNGQFADTADVEWHEGITLATYSNKVYILDADAGQIWKYQRGSTGFGGAAEYLDPEVVDVTEAVSMAIDGNIWMLSKGGSITKLLSGNPVDFFINKEPLTSLAGATKLYTELELNEIYILDPENSRLLIYSKSNTTEDITYSSQYVFDGLRGTLVDFYVDKSRNVIVLVTETGLYEFSF